MTIVDFFLHWWIGTSLQQWSSLFNNKRKSPTASGIWSLLRLCNAFASDFLVVFNAAKWLSTVEITVAIEPTSPWWQNELSKSSSVASLGGGRPTRVKPSRGLIPERNTNFLEFFWWQNLFYQHLTRHVSIEETNRRRGLCDCLWVAVAEKECLQFSFESTWSNV